MDTLRGFSCAYAPVVPPALPAERASGTTLWLVALGASALLMTVAAGARMNTQRVAASMAAAPAPLARLAPPASPDRPDRSDRHGEGRHGSGE
jgi:hypothetical protein